jgi:hypothetical protein
MSEFSKGMFSKRNNITEEIENIFVLTIRLASISSPPREAAFAIVLLRAGDTGTEAFLLHIQRNYLSFPSQLSYASREMQERK